MKTAFVFMTDQRGLVLTEHAVAAALVTQRTTQHIIVFCDGFEPPQQTRLQAEASNRGLKVEYRSLGGVNRPRNGYVATGAHAHVSSTTLLKMVAIEVLSTEFERVAYLDGDILLMKDFDLAQIDFGDATIAAVYDIARSGAMASEKDFFERCASYGRSPHYFNAGVIAADFRHWNSEFAYRYNEALDEHANGCDYKVNCSCPDQCAWNRAFERAWKRLPLTFNFQACAIFSESWTEAVVRHYVGPTKFIPFRPWRNDALDTALINRARNILGLASVGHWAAPLARSMNKIRNLHFAKASDAAIERIQGMYSEAM